MKKDKITGLLFFWFISILATVAEAQSNSPIANQGFAYKGKQDHQAAESHKKPSDTSKYTKLVEWQDGYLDIHHINTGSGDACFMIFPDGTTLLFDAGNLNQKRFGAKYAPMKTTSPKPDSSRSASQWIAKYIKDRLYNIKEPKIDYALVSHFHDDHYGSLVDLGRTIPIKKIIDRNYPDYDFPVDLKTYLQADNDFKKYLAFIEHSKVKTESLKAGSNTQITLKTGAERYPTFSVRNVKSNADIWTGLGENTVPHFTADDITTFYKGKFNENTLSLAIKIAYGPFDYFTGGDNTGLQGFGLPAWFDVETPMAKAVGKVEVTTLNHHGNRDATNDFFLKTLNPKVVVQQSWCSDHPGQEVFHRLIDRSEQAEPRAIFATNLFDELKVVYGPWLVNSYKSTQGHILVRVHPGGKTYEVIVLDDSLPETRVKKVFGPYHSID